MTPGLETYTSTIFSELHEEQSGGRPALQCTKTQTAMERLNPLLQGLEIMSRALKVDARTDFAEFCLSSHSAPAICVFRKNPLQTDQIRSLFQELSLGQLVEDFFWVLLARIPAERHALRVSLDRKLSIFFKMDVPTRHIRSIARAIGLDEHIEPVVRYFEETGRVPCGIAWELGETQVPRLRLYDNVIDFGNFGNTPPLMPLMPPDHLDILRDICGDEAALPSVLNFSVSHDDVTVKIEAPQVVLGDSSRPGLWTKERELLAVARATMTHCRIHRLNYFGLRFRGAKREVTCYLNALEARAQVRRAYAPVTSSNSGERADNGRSR